MGENSAIAWTDDTFNPWWGCKRVGPGCDNCYAATLDKRTGGDHWDGDTLPRRTSPQNWAKPRRWNKAAEQDGQRRKVFSASMADIFDNRVPPQWRDDVWALVRETPNLDWIILTKRIGNVPKMLPADWDQGYPNVWLCITTVTQGEFDRDWPKLKAIPAAVRGLSIEPQLEPITLRGERPGWVIAGAESGHGARPYSDDWARKLRDECSASGTPFFFKQHIRSGKKIETPELDGRRWIEFPSVKGRESE